MTHQTIKDKIKEIKFRHQITKDYSYIKDIVDSINNACIEPVLNLAVDSGIEIEIKKDRCIGTTISLNFDNIVIFGKKNAWVPPSYKYTLNNLYQILNNEVLDFFNKYDMVKDLVHYNDNKKVWKSPSFFEKMFETKINIPETYQEYTKELETIQPFIVNFFENKDKILSIFNDYKKKNPNFVIDISDLGSWDVSITVRHLLNKNVEAYSALFVQIPYFAYLPSKYKFKDVQIIKIFNMSDSNKPLCDFTIPKLHEILKELINYQNNLMK